MEKDFDSKLKLQATSSNGGNVQKSKSFAFRAPQENFTVQDFELGKIYGVGSYSKVFILETIVPLYFLDFCSFLAFWVVLVCFVFAIDCWLLIECLCVNGIFFSVFLICDKSSKFIFFFVCLLMGSNGEWVFEQ